MITGTLSLVSFDVELDDVGARGVAGLEALERVLVAGRLAVRQRAAAMGLYSGEGGLGRCRRGCHEGGREQGGDCGEAHGGHPMGMSDDRVLLITGASTGIGASTARHAVDAGYRVVLAARSEDKLRELASSLGDAAVAVPTDVTDWEANEALAAAALERVRADRRRVRERRLRRQARLPRGDARVLALDDPDQRARRRLHGPRDAAAPARARQRPLPADVVGGRPPRRCPGRSTRPPSTP